MQPVPFSITQSSRRRPWGQGTRSGTRSGSLVSSVAARKTGTKQRHENAHSQIVSEFVSRKYSEFLKPEVFGMTRNSIMHCQEINYDWPIFSSQ